MFRGNRLLLRFWIALLCLTAVLCKPLLDNTRNKRSIRDTDALKYLETFNYMGHGNNNFGTMSGSLRLPSSISGGLRRFQAMWGLPVTGRLDAATKELMLKERCGVPDVITMASDAKRKRRYAKEGSRWKKNDLTYRILQYPNLPQQNVDAEIRRSLQVWADVTPLTFRQVRSGPADIHMRFVARSHGDNNPFDGPRGTLAHAFFPRFGGDVHFDHEETWTINAYTEIGNKNSKFRNRFLNYLFNDTKPLYIGVNLFQVASHELGHSLGLVHSNDRNALMAPFYRGYQPNFRLNQDDIIGIQAIYGKQSALPPIWVPRPVPRTTVSWYRPRTPVPTVQPRTSTFCYTSGFDTITELDDGHVYAFRGQYYTRILDGGGSAPGYPRRIRDGIIGLPDYIDASVYWKATNDECTWTWTGSQWVRQCQLNTGGRTYFFKGSRYYRVQNNHVLAGYPKDIRTGFPGLPDNLDAAFVWSGNGRTYFVKGGNYYRYKRNVGVEPGYPHPLSVWANSHDQRSKLFSRLNAAFQYNAKGRTYFFYGDSYFRFNDYTFRIDPGYPISIRKGWLKCPGYNGQLRFEGDAEDQFAEVGNEPTTVPSGKQHSGNRGQVLTAKLWNSLLLALLAIAYRPDF